MYRTALWIFGTLLVGCGLNEEKFEEKYADAYCEWLEGCAKLNDKYGTMESCITAEKINADETLTPDECKFDGDNAKECLQEIKNNDDCDMDDSIPDECLLIADCRLLDTGVE